MNTFYDSPTEFVVTRALAVERERIVAALTAVAQDLGDWVELERAVILDDAIAIVRGEA